MELNPAELVKHVNDAKAFELPFGIEFGLPKVFGHQVTKFMVLELVAAIVMVAIFVPLARMATKNGPPKGRFWNAFEAVVVFLRDGVARQAIGRHDGDRFLPFVATMFFFILICNLLGLFPWLGSPTASFSVTAPLALMTFCLGVGAGMKKNGIVRFWTGLCPPLDIPILLKIPLVPLVLVIEIIGLVIRYSVLAVRLLANMFGGHLGLAIIVAFIPAVAGSLIWIGVMPMAVFGGAAVSLLELLIAFLQAYIFVFLAALFIGMGLHQH